MDVYTFDLETYYDTDYSLSKMQTDAYCLDPRFELIGMGIAKNDGPAHWFTDPLEVDAVLARIDWPNVAVRCHNTLFDGFIITQVLGYKPKLWMDTLSQARMVYPYLVSHSLGKLAEHFQLAPKGDEVVRALGKHRADFSSSELAAYGEYCKTDVEICRDLGELLDMRTPPLNAYLIDMTIRMFTEPVLVGDVAMMKRLHSDEVTRKEELLAKAAVNRDIIMSNDKLADALVTLGIRPPTKISVKTGKEAWAFAKSDKEFTELLEHDDPEVQALVAARLGVKTTIAETRAQTFVEMAERGPLAVYLQFWGAKTTGRYSSGNRSGWQNLPARGPSAGVRKAIKAPPGHAVVVGDSSNIELRMVMACAGQDDVVDKLRNGVDLYCDFASTLFGAPVTKADKPERQLGKVACIAEGQQVLTNFGLVPIEKITTLHRVWDGVEFVHHDGVVLQGVKRVINYGGVTATPDHIVCLDDGRWMPLGEAAQSGSRIATTERGGAPVRFVGYPHHSDTREQPHTGRVPMPVRGSEVGGHTKPSDWEVYGVQALRDCGASSGGGTSGGKDSFGRGAAAQSYRHAGPLPAANHKALGAIWWAGHRVSVRLGAGVRGILANTARLLCCVGGGSGGQQRALCAGELAVCVAQGSDNQPCEYREGNHPGRSSSVSRVAQPIQHRDYIQVRNNAGDVERADRGAGAAGGSRPAEELAWARFSAGTTRVYDIVNAGPRHRFTVSGKLVHNCLGLQYGAGAERFQEMVRNASRVDPSLQPITLDRAHEIVYLYRTAHHKVKQLWDYCGEVILPDIAAGGNMRNVDVNGWAITMNNGFGRPGEPGVVYHDLKYENREWTYQMGRMRVKIYSSKVVENLCVDGAALVLTQAGWKRLDAILDTDLVHDGVEFVQHRGKVFKGLQHCVIVDGVRMTPEHEVLTDDGWTQAKDNPRPYRPDIRGHDGFASVPFPHGEAVLGVPVRVWDCEDSGGERPAQRDSAGGNPELWVHDKSPYQGEEQNTRDEPSPCVRGLAEHVRQVPVANAPSMGELWRAGDSRVRRMAGIIRGVLGRCWTHICARTDAGSNRQRRPVLATELSVGHIHPADEQQAGELAHMPQGASKDDRYREDYFGAPVAQGTTGRRANCAPSGGAVEGGEVGAGCAEREVWDLMDCGPRQRFVVLGADGPFIVHNCQHMAMLVVMWQTARIHKRVPVKLSVHDEAVTVPLLTDVQATRDYMTECLSLAPPWCRGVLPLACEVEHGPSYGESKS